MKKTTFFILLFCCLQNLFSQCNPVSNSNPISRGVLAGVIFGKLYEDNTNVYDYAAAEFPNPFIDLQDNSELTNKLKVLSYLQYDNGVTVFNYTNDLSFCFKPTSPITKIEALIYIMEAWNIHPDFSASSLPYNDISNSGIIFAYVHAAYDEGIITSSSNFNPFSNISIGEATDIICSIYNSSSLHPVSEDLTDIDNYFNPGLYSPQSLSQLRGLNQGVFNHYAKNSFTIPDRKLSLNFSHFYSTSMVELPEGFYPLKPLGRGWSHTYNSYILREDNVGANGTDYYYIVWSDGTIDIYNEDDDEYESIGVYDELDELSGDRIRITHKDQSRHYFKQLDNDRDIWYLIEIRDANGNSIDIEYESAEENDTRRIEYVEAPSGKQLEFEYESGTDLIERIEDPMGRRLEFEYSDLWQGYYETLVTFEDAKGNNTTYQYYTDNDSQQYLLRRIDLPRGNHIEAEYDSNGKLEQYRIDGDDPVAIDVNFDYENNSYTSQVETPVAGSNNPFVANYQFNENGLVTDYSSDTNNITISYPNSGINVARPTDVNDNGVDIEYDYDSRGNVTKINKENGDIIEEFEYDNDNNLTEYTDGEGNITEFFYDSDENLIEIKDAYNNSIFFTYDTYGQLLSQTNQEGIAVNYAYETDGAVSSISAPAGIISNFSYDSVNRLTQRSDNGLVSTYQYDDNDNLIQITNSGGFVTSYTYDANDNLTNILNANNVSISFTYDDQDRVIQEQFGTLITQFDYGDEGYLEEIIKPSGQDMDYEYDDEGRLKETETITDIDYNSRNLVKDITNATGQMEFRYDDLNRLERFDTVHGHRIEYDYNDVNQVDDIEYPILNGVECEVNYSYDNKNRIWQVVLLNNIGSNGLVIAEYEYFDDDRIKWIDLGNDMRIRYVYDNAGRLKQLQHTNQNSGSTLYFEEHDLDPRGNITETDQLFTPLPSGHNTNTPSSATNTYGYDNNSQITTGNGESYNVDDDGNTISFGQNTSLTFDVEDRLTSYTDVDNTFNFKYNSYNQRVEATRNGITKRYVRDLRLDNILVELDSNNNPIQYFIYAPNGMLLCRMMSNGDLDYYHGDIRGSVIMITDENANITHQYRYDDFGTITRWSEPSNSNNPFRYVGIYGVEYETNDFYYMRARYYKPSIGRFLSEDPFWSTNLYPYADNNPITNIDPKGEQSQDLIFRGDPWVYLSYNFSSQVNGFKEYVSSPEFISDTFTGMEKGGDYAVILGGAMVLTGIGAPAGGILMTYGGYSSAAGSIGNSAIELQDTKNNAEFAATALVELSGIAYSYFLKKLGIGDFDRTLLEYKRAITVGTIKKLNEND